MCQSLFDGLEWNEKTYKSQAYHSMRALEKSASSGYHICAMFWKEPKAQGFLARYPEREGHRMHVEVVRRGIDDICWLQLEAEPPRPYFPTLHLKPVSISRLSFLATTDIRDSYRLIPKSTGRPRV